MIKEEIQRVTANANLAIKMFADVKKCEIDFDEKSLELVDKFISNEASAFEAETRLGLISVFGAFLGECVRKNLGGCWDVINGELGMLFDEKNAVYPFSKVKKQLENGSEDSILGFYQMIPIVFRIKQ